MLVPRGLNRMKFERCLYNFLRTLMFIVFGLANLNNGLTSHGAKDNRNDELHRIINQNLIMSSSSVMPGSPLASTGLISSSLSSSASDMPYPPSSISASSSQYQHTSGSSIKSFDSSNVIDEQQQKQEQHFSSRQLGRDTIAQRPTHKIMGVGSIGDGNVENQLDASGESADVFHSAPMYFGTENSTVVSTQIGATAHIPCTVHHIGDGVVSWIRKKDYHLLTVGLTTYSSDERFSATHLKHSEDWTLQIKFVQLRDAGVYECQVSTHPPTSIFLHLNVVEARAEISGPPIRYLTPGSTLRLQCRVVQNTEASEFIFWYHDNRMINYDIDRGINVSTDPDFQSSELTILRTRREHSGNFTCVASNTQPASILVHIFKGDNPAAMYHGHVGSSTKSYQTHLHSIMVIIALGYRIWHCYVHMKIV